MAFEERMPVRVRVEWGADAKAVKLYVECVCTHCKSSFRVAIPIGEAQKAQITRCPLCGTSFSNKDVLGIIVLVESIMKRMKSMGNAIPLHLTGTCANCKSRFRFDARVVSALQSVECPHCGFDFGEEGRVKIIERARQMLAELSK